MRTVLNARVGLRHQWRACLSVCVTGFHPDDVTGAVSVETGIGATDWTVNLGGLCADRARCSSQCGWWEERAREKHFHLVRPADSVHGDNSRANTFFFALTRLIHCDHPLLPLSVAHQCFSFPFLYFYSVFLYVAAPSFVSPSFFMLLFHVNCSNFAFWVQSFSWTSLPPSCSSLSLLWTSSLLLFYFGHNMTQLHARVSIQSAFVCVCIHLCLSQFMCLH